MKKLLVILIGVAGFGSSSMAEAQTGLMFSPSFMFWSYEDKVSGAGAEVSAQYLDVRLGYISAGGIYFGGLYHSMNRDNGGTDQKRNALGASIGIVYNQFFIIGHYVLSSEYEITPSNTLEDGKGFQFDLGYLFNVTSSFYAGPQVTIRNIEYDKADGVKVSDTSASETLPYLSLAFVF